MESLTILTLLGVDLGSGSSARLEFYCLCDGLLCTNYRLLKDGSFAFRCRRCRRFDKEFVEKLMALWGNEEFTVIPSVNDSSPVVKKRGS